MPNQKTIEEFPSEIELRDALMYAQDIMERCQIPFVVLGSAAYQIYNDQPLNVPRVTIGVLKQHADPTQMSLIRSIDPSIEVNMDGWTFTVGSAKVVCRVLTKKYHTLTDPDKHWYWVEPFNIPNPFDEYWNSEDHYDV